MFRHVRLKETALLSSAFTGVTRHIVCCCHRISMDFIAGSEAH